MYKYNRIKILIFARFLAMVLIAALFSCSATKNLPDHKPIYFTTDKGHDTLDLKLSDIANIKYVALKGEPFDTVARHVFGIKFYIDSINRYIYNTVSHAERTSTLVQYDFKGNYIRHLNSSPNKFLSKDLVIDFYVLPKKNRIGVKFCFARQIHLYDTTFVHKRKTKNLPFIYDLKPLNDKMVLISTSRDKRAYNDKRKQQKKYPYFAISSLRGRCKGRYDTSYAYNKEISFHDVYNFQYGDGGIFMHYINSDSIMWIDKSGKKFYPRLIDLSESIKPYKGIKISCETDKYLFFNQLEIGISNYKADRTKFYAYDKYADKTYSIAINSEKDYGFYNLAYYDDLFSDRCSFTFKDSSATEGTLIVVIPTSYFKNYNHKEGSQAAEVAASIVGNESAVIAIIKLK